MVKGNFKKIIVSVGLTSLLIGTSITSVNAAVQPQRIAVFQAHFQGLLKKGPIPGSKELSPAELQCLNDSIYGVKNGNDRIDGSKVWDYVVGSRHGKNPTPPKDKSGKAPLSCNLPQPQAQPPMNAPAPTPQAQPPVNAPTPAQNAPTPAQNAPTPAQNTPTPAQNTPTPPQNAPTPPLNAPAPTPMHEPMPPVQDNAPVVQPAFPKGPSGSGSSMESSTGSNGSIGGVASEFQPTPEQKQGGYDQGQQGGHGQGQQGSPAYNPTPEQKKQDDAFKEKIHEQDFTESFGILNDVQGRYADLMDDFNKRYSLGGPTLALKKDFDANSKKLFDSYYKLLNSNDKAANDQLVKTIKDDGGKARKIALEDMRALVDSTHPKDKNAPTAMDIKVFIAELKQSGQSIPVSLDILTDFLVTKGYSDSNVNIGNFLLNRSSDYINPDKANINNSPQLIKNIVALQENPLQQQMKNLMDRDFLEKGTTEQIIALVKDLSANAPDDIVKDTVQKVKDKTLNKIIREHSKKSFDKFKELTR